MYTTTNNQSIYYQKVGKGLNLVLLHGFGQDVSTWWGITDLLKDDFTLWLIDLPGFGRSENPKKPFSVKDYADIIQGFIKENKITNATVLGHSLGGRVAIKLASLHPYDLTRLVLEDTAGIRPDKNILQSLSLPAAKIIKYLMPDLFGLKTRLRHRVYRKLESDYLTALDKPTFINVINEDLTSDMKKIKTETLVLWGEKDRTVPLVNARRIYQIIGNSRLEIIDNVGHFPHLENPVIFAYWVKNFCL